MTKRLLQMSQLLIDNAEHYKYIKKDTITFCVKNGDLICVNDTGNTASMIGLSKKDDILGLDDYAIKTPAVALASEFRARDRHAFNSKHPVIDFTFARYDGSLSAVLSHKEKINHQELAINVWQVAEPYCHKLFSNAVLQKMYDNEININFRVIDY